MELSEFSKRLAQLRINNGSSARDMSLSLGQGATYINNIENGIAFPSMTAFFYICEFLGITPSEFFDTECPDPSKLNELKEEAKELNTMELNHLIEIVRDIKR